MAHIICVIHMIRPILTVGCFLVTKTAVTMVALFALLLLLSVSSHPHTSICVYVSVCLFQSQGTFLAPERKIQ
jgi:hypothetical protein